MHKHRWVIHSVKTVERPYSAINHQGKAITTFALWRCSRCCRVCSQVLSGEWSLPELEDTKPS